MLTHHAQNYFVEAVALWLSFLPAFGVIGLILAAQIHQIRRAMSRRANYVPLSAPAYSTYIKYNSLWPKHR